MPVGLKKQSGKWLLLHFEKKGYRNTNRYMSGIITLTTDWGTGDPYAALFRAHVWRINPQAVVTDISHGVYNGNRQHAAYLLGSACWAFPEGTVHVVDVREFTHEQQIRICRRERSLPFMDFLAVRCGEQYFLMENNGILSLLSPDFSAVSEVVKLSPHADFDHYNTFNALNHYVFAAARLSAGGALSELGEPYPENLLERIVLPNMQPSDDSIEGRILHIDARGNLITDIREEMFPAAIRPKSKLVVSVGGCFERLNDVLFCKRYLMVPDNKCFALFNSGGYLEIGQKNVSLATLLYGEFDRLSGIGDTVTLRFA